MTRFFKTEPHEVFSIEVPEEIRRYDNELGGFIVPSHLEWYWTTAGEPVRGGPFVSKMETEKEAKKACTVELDQYGM
jgi:hypothetical protein